ncbi:8010_t:CDS:2 [Diversispora eburnea]|uniref:8010_t:CDS:1 n=1 Tax=Diversispora eburnea TaxID=1213867 RepID=A0A9N9BEW7_9GLOM|nr:8010_t:CDS:2 [Diversispora eburnea]
MFFFFVCSLSPHFTRLRTSPTRCPNCLDPSPTVYQYKKQNRLSIFFIPVWWFKSEDIWHCEKCNWDGRARPEEDQIRRSEETEMVQQLGPLPTWGLTRCRNCNKEINVSGRIKYCPYCGNSVEG